MSNPSGGDFPAVSCRLATRRRHTRFDPGVPVFQSFAALRRQLKYREPGVDRERVGTCLVDIEAQMRQQIDLAQQNDRGGAEDMRIFQGLVLALGYREQDHLGLFAEIEQRRTDEIADVLDHEDGVRLGLEHTNRALEHLGLEVASAAGIDLHRPRPRGPNPLRIVGGGLVPLDDRYRDLTLQIAQRALEQSRLARTGTAHDVEREDSPAGQPASVALGDELVLGENVRLELDEPAVAPGDREVRPLRRGMRMSATVPFIGVGVRVIMIMRMIVRAFAQPSGVERPVRISVTVPGTIRVHVLGLGKRNDAIGIDPAAAAYAHGSTSISLILSSSPAMTLSRGAPHSQQRPAGTARGTSASQSSHRARPAISTISSSAPSSGVPREQTSKQNRTASGMMADRRPISSRTRMTRSPAARSATAATTLRVMDNSCISRSGEAARQPACRGLGRSE